MSRFGRSLAAGSAHPRGIRDGGSFDWQGCLANGQVDPGRGGAAVIHNQQPLENKPFREKSGSRSSKARFLRSGREQTSVCPSFLRWPVRLPRRPNG